MGYSLERLDEVHTDLHILIITRERSKEKVDNRKFKNEGLALSLLQSLQYISGLCEEMSNGNCFRSIKYALRIPLNLLGSDAEIGEKSRADGVAGQGGKSEGAFRHERWLKMAAEMREHSPLITKTRMAQLIAKREAEAGRQVGSDAVRKV